MNYEKIDIRSLKFAIDISKYTLLLKDKKHYNIASQLFRSWASVWDNIAEAQSWVSKKNFINKMSIALKEARENFYWLELLKDGFKENIDDLKLECESIIKILVVIINRTKINLKKQS